MIRVFTDTAANLPPEVLEKYHIRTLPLTYRVDGELPEGEFDGPAYYDAIRGGAEVKTAMVNPQDTAEGMEPVLAAGDDLLYIGISGGISGTCWSVGLAADELMAKYPGRQLRVIDSRMRSRMQQFFVVDDLKYLHKGGRISGGAKLAGTILNIKPILQSDEEGKIILRSKVRGKNRAIEELANLYAQFCNDPTQTIGLAHADCPADMLRLHSLLREKGHTGEILTVCYEPVTGSHVGPGALALFFMGEAWR